MATRLHILIAACPLLVLSVTPAARADPIAITGGEFVIAWDDPSSFNISGAGLHLSGLFVRTTTSPQLTCFAGCAPGTVVDLSSGAGGSGFGLGTSTLTATVNGTSFVTPGDPTTFLELAGTFRFDAATAVVPPLPSGGGIVDLLSPFVFTGDVAGFRRSDLGGEPAFNLTLVGEGTARLRLVATEAGRFGFPEVTYTFAPADPVPEPTTILLCGSGLTMLATRARRLRRTRRADENQS